MNIWGWVSATKRELRSAGQERLAELMSALPSLVCDNEHARVEALVPEALGLARAAKLPWVEVFVRHWLLQSRVFHRHEVGRSRHEAVSLLEFASRDETQGCPQSVCVTQDLAGCFARVDGPGYVSERLQVARESLDRIDPSWPCYACISSEYADALIDGGEQEEALRFIRGQVAKAAAQGEFLEEEFALSEAHALILLGRHQEAVARLDGHHHPAGGESHVLETRLMRAWALVGLGRFAEAAAVRPSFAAIRTTADHYESWVMATQGLVRGEAVANDVELGRQLRELVQRLEANGALWGAVQTAIVALELALARGAVEIAGLIRADAQRLRAELRRPPKLPPLDGDGDGLQHDPEGDPEDDPATLLAGLPEDPERALDRLAAARRRFPDDPQIAAGWSQALRSVGFPERGLSDLEVFAAGHPTDGGTLLELCRLHLACGDSAAIAELSRDRLRAFPELYPTGLWLLAQAEEKAGAIDAAIVTLRVLVDLAPEAALPRMRLADLLRAQGRYSQALELRRRLVEVLEPGPHDWDLMTEATIAGEWALVRRSAARLGIPAQPAGEGPIDGSYGLCRISLGVDEVPGKRRGLLWAERRGPVTARIIQVTGPGSREHYDDLVVFDAANIDGPDGPDGPDASAQSEGEAEEENPRRHPVFRSVEVLERGDTVSYSLDGPHPEEPIVEGLRQLFDDLGGRLWVCSGENYRLRDREDAEGESGAPELLGFYAYGAVSRDVPPGELHARLTELLASAAYPLAWVELAEALPPGPERDAAIERQEALVARFGL